jgi:cytochrome c
MVPDNDMPFEGIKDARVRADLLCVPQGGHQTGCCARANRASGDEGDWGGMMGGMMGADATQI